MKNTLKAIIFILIFIIIIVFLNKLINPAGTMGVAWRERKPVDEIYLQPENTIDSLYVGASSVYCGVSPLEVYKINGTTGYTYSSSCQAVWTSYYLIKEAFRTQKPKVVFLETEEFFMTKDTQFPIDNRMDMDELEFSQNKIDMVNDPIYGLSPYDKLTVYVPVLYYHTRWKDIGKDDLEKFKHKKSEKLYKGYIYKDKIVQPQNIQAKRDEIKAENRTSQVSDEVKEYVQKIKQLCDENDCKLVLFSMPYELIYVEERSNSIKEFAQELNIDFMDLNRDENIKIDWQKDSLDEHGNHLNIYGAEKVGQFFANYINNNFSIEDHRSDERYQAWNEALKKYEHRKQIKEENKLGE